MAEQEQEHRVVFLAGYRAQTHIAALSVEAAMAALEQAQYYANEASAAFPGRGDIARDVEYIRQARMHLRDVKRTLHNVYGV